MAWTVPARGILSARSLFLRLWDGLFTVCGLHMFQLWCERVALSFAICYKCTSYMSRANLCQIGYKDFVL